MMAMTDGAALIHAMLRGRADTLARERAARLADEEARQFKAQYPSEVFEAQYAAELPRAYEEAAKQLQQEILDGFALDVRPSLTDIPDDSDIPF